MGSEYPSTDLDEHVKISFDIISYVMLNKITGKEMTVLEDFPGGDEILYRRSTDGGATFGPTENLSNNAGSSETPAIAAADNSVYVVWRDSTPGNFEILYRRSTDGGATFGPTENLSNNAGSSTRPSIAAIGSNVNVAWEDNTG